MLLRASALFLLTGAVSCSRRATVKIASKADDIVPNVNVSILMGAVGTPYCMKPCLGRFAFVAKKMLSFNQTTENFEEFCSEFAESKKCLDKRKWCRARNIFDAATSGIEHACVTRRPDFDKAKPCLRTNLDAVLKNCDSKCNLRSALATFSEENSIKTAALAGGNLFTVAKKLAPTCAALHCAFPCIVNDANAKCAKTGTLILDAVLQPFDKAAALYEKAPQMTRKLVHENLKEKCMPFVEEKALAKMRKGEF